MSTKYVDEIKFYRHVPKNVTQIYLVMAGVLRLLIAWVQRQLIALLKPFFNQK